MRVEVFCVNGFEYMTYGKSYEIHSAHANDEDGYDIVYVITNDNNETDTYSEHDFISVCGWRDRKLKELGI